MTTSTIQRLQSSIHHGAATELNRVTTTAIRQRQISGCTGPTDGGGPDLIVPEGHSTAASFDLAPAGLDSTVAGLDLFPVYILLQLTQPSRARSEKRLSPVAGGKDFHAHTGNLAGKTGEGKQLSNSVPGEARPAGQQIQTDWTFPLLRPRSSSSLVSCGLPPVVYLINDAPALLEFHCCIWLPPIDAPLQFWVPCGLRLLMGGSLAVGFPF